MTAEFRLRLHQASNGCTPEQNIKEVAALAADFPHTIVSVNSEPPLLRYTCLVHALDFTERRDYVMVAMSGSVFAGAAFAHWLLAQNAMHELCQADAVAGSLVWYFKVDGHFAHVGILLEGGRVRSKWGTLGLFEHGLYEVPSTYGDHVRYFAPLLYDDAIHLFYDFAAENGVEFK